MDPTMAPRRPNALETAAMDAQRVVLLGALRASGWSLSETARALGMVGPAGQPQSANVLRAVRRLGLSEEYEAHKPG